MTHPPCRKLPRIRPFTVDELDKLGKLLQGDERRPPRWRRDREVCVHVVPFVAEQAARPSRGAASFPHSLPETLEIQRRHPNLICPTAYPAHQHAGFRTGILECS